jgi:hypothetical protein
MISQNTFVSLRKQPLQFGAWPAGRGPQALNALVENIEAKLETPPAPLPVVNEAQRLEQYPVQVRPRILEIQGHLKKVEPNNGYGMALALDVLNLQAETGYQLTPQETDKFNILVKKSGYDLESALRYFPRKNEWDRSSGAYTQEGLERFLNVWLASQNSYLPVKNMMDKAGASPQFQMTSTMEEAFRQRLESLYEALNNPAVHAAQLKQLGNSFRPKFTLVDDLKKIFNVLMPAEGLFAEQVQQDVAQATALIAERNATVIFAGKLANGQLYVFTQSTESHWDRFFVGAPGEMQEVQITDGSRAMDGSDSSYILANGQSYRFLRGGMGAGRDLKQWRATVNGELIPTEFPVFQLEE